MAHWHIGEFGDKKCLKCLLESDNKEPINLHILRDQNSFLGNVHNFRVNGKLFRIVIIFEGGIDQIRAWVTPPHTHTQTLYENARTSKAPGPAMPL